MPLVMSMLVKSTRLVGDLVLAVVLAMLACTVGPAGEAIAGSPAASFVWVPASPHTGEPVALASASTDASSAITGLACDLAGNVAFDHAGPVITTLVSPPGSHTVRCSV